MENVKNMLEEAGSKMNSVIGDVEDLTISKNYKVNILDVLDELKHIREIILYVQSKVDHNDEGYFINKQTGMREIPKFELD